MITFPIDFLIQETRHNVFFGNFSAFRPNDFRNMMNGWSEGGLRAAGHKDGTRPGLAGWGGTFRTTKSNITY